MVVDVRDEPLFLTNIAIVGSSKLTEKQSASVKWLISAILFSSWGEEQVVSGGAKGVDSIAEEVANLYGIPVKTFLPDIPKWEGHYDSFLGQYLKGFKDRNKQIAEYCDTLIAIRSRFSTTYGSGWTADYAEEIGKEVFRYYV